MEQIQLNNAREKEFITGLFSLEIFEEAARQHEDQFQIASANFTAWLKPRYTKKREALIDNLKTEIENNLLLITNKQSRTFCLKNLQKKITELQEDYNADYAERIWKEGIAIVLTIEQKGYIIPFNWYSFYVTDGLPYLKHINELIQEYRKQESIETEEYSTKEDKAPKLKWSGMNVTLYDVFKQCKEKGWLDNTLEELADFIYQNVEFTKREKPTRSTIRVEVSRKDERPIKSRRFNENEPRQSEDKNK